MPAGSAHPARPGLFKVYGFVALAGAWPLINFAISNAAWLGGAPRGFVLVAAVAVAVIAISLAGLWLLLKLFGRGNAVRLAFFVASGLLILFSFDTLSRAFMVLFDMLNVSLSAPYGYAAVFVLAPLILLALVNRKAFLDFGFIAAAVAVAASIFQLAAVGLSVEGDAAPASPPAKHSTPSSGVAPAQGRELPNIYHVVADQYARNDQLMAILGYDNSGFTDELRKRGLRVLPKARSNYRETAFSLPSMHAMDYPFTDEQPLPPTLKDVFTPHGGANAVMRLAWSLGYDYLHIDTNIWGVTACPPHERVVCLTPRNAELSSWDVEILEAISKMTPLSYFFSLNTDIHKATTIDDVTAAVLARGFDRQQLMFAHTMQPHSPYIFKADCSPQPSVSFNLSGPGNPSKYVEAIQCVNRMILRFVDAIAARDPNAIVILSSDHGSKFTLNEAAGKGVWTKRQFDERYGALLAIRAPKQCLDQLSDDMTLVNVYRWSFACVRGEEPELLENRYYDVSYDAFTTDRQVRRFPDEGPPN